jgi:hypothetical protein
MKLVFICSPYRADDDDPLERAKTIQRNIQMARTGCRIAVERGFIPIAPHLYFPQFLREDTEREIGIGMGLHMLSMCDELWVLGRKVSDGMAKEISCARELGLPVRIMEHPETGAERLMKAVKE